MRQFTSQVIDIMKHTHELPNAVARHSEHGGVGMEIGGTRGDHIHDHAISFGVKDVICMHLLCVFRGWHAQLPVPVPVPVPVPYVSVSVVVL